MAEHHVKFRASADIELWIEADSPEHAAELVRNNNPADYSRVQSTVDIGTGAIIVDTDTIEIKSVD